MLGLAVRRLTLPFSALSWGEVSVHLRSLWKGVGEEDMSVLVYRVTK